MLQEKSGKAVIESLAEIYQQLYIPPEDGAEEKYADVVKRGHDPENKDLSHFITNKGDRLEYADTPEGKVLVVTLQERQDFVTFLRIMANRCDPVKIPDTQGASTISGIVNWSKIRTHKEAFLKEKRAEGIFFPDWNTEFKNFTSVKENYLDVMIVLAAGPYSGIPGSVFSYSEDEWLSLSHTIRLYHECTHFICSKRYPDRDDPVMDELEADAVGIFAALGRFDPAMEEKFLGIESGRYVGGRLENYVPEASAEERKALLDELASKVSGILADLAGKIEDKSCSGPFDVIGLI